ncbi:peptidase S8/S53 domain-containing protein [Catenaria anguillulae PL171]|uniref:Peptidase S8/S53 domain-containing protein n=1 Tax=Catenaria anguillulae PL171 TaxID=765915 RepID=A0A1Y2H4N5_9FUNG|nr:peptidase S8/S53 domain-containing protein [Catenaria anguillulae PL171]
MPSITFLASFAVLLTALSLPAAQAQRDPPADAVVPDSYIITFKSDISTSNFGSVTQSLHAILNRESANGDSDIQSAIDSSKTASIGTQFRTVPATLSASTADQLRRHPAVASVSRNMRYKVSAPVPAPAPAGFSVQSAPVPNWGLARIATRQLPSPLSASTFNYPAAAGANVAVYVIDTGIHLAHQDLAGRVEWGTTTCSNCKDRADVQGHGSHVAGISCGSTFGVAKKAKCIAVKALDDEGFGTTADIVKGIEWAVTSAKARKGEKAVINMSIHGYEDKVMNAAVEAAVREGITVVVAAGNKGQSACYGSPSSAPSAVVVGATNDKDWMPTFSNYGSCVTLLAPGVDILSIATGTTNGSKLNTGTSMASPMVAGVAALLLSQDPTLTPEQIRNKLVGAATDGVLHDTVYGTPNKLVFAGDLMK